MKQRITRKMKRELKQAVNPLEELLIIIKQYFTKLTNWIDDLMILGISHVSHMILKCVF